MKRSPLLRRHGFALLGIACGVVAFGTPSVAEAVFACLPARNCQGVEACCKKSRLELWLQIARAEQRRDFFGSSANRDAAFARDAWASVQTMDRNARQAAQEAEPNAVEVLEMTHAPYADVPDLQTNPETCVTTVPGTSTTISAGDIPKIFDDKNHPLTAANVCKEAIAAAVHHEMTHQERCAARKAGRVPAQTSPSWARRELDEYADAEQEAYAAEAETLRRYYREAKRRCTTAQALADDKFKNAEEKVQALREMAQPRRW